MDDRRGKPINITVVAIARELAGFIWDISHQFAAEDSDRLMRLWSSVMRYPTRAY